MGKKKQKPLDYRTAAEVYLQGKEALAGKLHEEAISSFDIGTPMLFVLILQCIALKKQYEACVKEQEMRTFEKLLKKVVRLLTNYAHEVLKRTSSQEKLVLNLYDKNTVWLEEYKMCPEMLIKNLNNISLLWKKQKQFQRALYFLNTAFKLLERYPHVAKGSTLLNMGSIYSASSQ